MKTKEFISKINKLGVGTFMNEDDFITIIRDGFNIAYIGIDNQWFRFGKYKQHFPVVPKEIAELILEYYYTPLNER